MINSSNERDKIMRAGEFMKELIDKIEEMADPIATASKNRIKQLDIMKANEKLKQNTAKRQKIVKTIRASTATIAPVAPVAPK